MLRIFKGREKLENASSRRNLHHNMFTISGVFCKRQINDLIKEAHECAKNKMVIARQKSIKVKTSNEYGEWVNENVIEPKKLDNIILDGKQALLDDIDNFLTKKEWYKEREIAYKRGYLLEGKAGTGKTTLVMAIAKKLNRTLHFLQTSRIDDKSLRYAFRSLPPKSILVIEDIDAVFNQREDGSSDIKFSFSTLLNCLDGVFATEDVIVIFTTNHKERLDSALIRSGRIDYKMEFEMPTKEYVEFYLQNFYDSDSLLQLPDSYRENLAMVDIQDSCLRNTDSFEGAVEHIMETSEDVFKNPRKEVFDFSKLDKRDFTRESNNIPDREYIHLAEHNITRG